MVEDWTNEQIISDVLGRGADIDIGAPVRSWRLSRWRQFVGAYELPALPDPTFVVHIAGKSQVKTKLDFGWSETSSIPGCATILPAGRPSGWLVDGELDVVTLSISRRVLSGTPSEHQFAKLRFAFSDPLGVALTRQVLNELYAPQDDARRDYMAVLVDTLKTHMIYGPGHMLEHHIPTSDFSAYRLHQVMNHVTRNLGEDHSVEMLASMVNLTPSHFCRVFKQATNLTPHRYVMKMRLEKARELLMQSNLSLAEISDLLGFNSQSHFTRAFRDFSGSPPGTWRQDQAVSRAERRASVEGMGAH